MISYVPAFLHVHVARACIAEKIHMVTASYISPDLKNLEKDVLDSNLIFFNEVGLDPGIDHIQAMQFIEEIKGKKGK